MTWIAVAVGGGALLGGIASGVGSSSAAKTQANASEQAAQIQQNEFNTITQQETPYMQAGYGALGSLDYLLGVNPITSGQSAPGGGGISNVNGSGPVTGNVPSVLQGGVPQASSVAASSPSLRPTMGVPANNRDTLGSVFAGNGFAGIPGALNGSTQGAAVMPGAANVSSSGSGGFGSLLAPFTAATMAQYSPAYQFQRQQGMQGTLNGTAAGQGALSGAAQQALVGFNQNYANTAFGNAFNQYQTQQGNIYNRLAGVAQLGQTSAADTGQQGTSIAANTGQAISNVGSAQAAGQVGVANAISGSLGTLGMLPYLQNQMSAMNQLTPVETTAQYM